MPDISTQGASPPDTADPFRLQRFVDAQEGVHDTALAELRAGKKRSHWMWFVFPQLRGLGQSPMAQFYGVSSLDEARAYLAHPVLGPRLRSGARAVVDSPGRTVAEIFGSPDDMKFRSSMTLFALAADQREGVFREALTVRCEGEMDERTAGMLGLDEAGNEPAENQ